MNKIQKNMQKQIEKINNYIEGKAQDDNIDDKVLALIKHLQPSDTKEVDSYIETITQSRYDDDTYIVNSKLEKQGEAPQYYIDTIEEFKNLLSKKDIEMINNYLQIKDGFDKPFNKHEEKATNNLREGIKKKIETKPVIKDWLYNDNIIFNLLHDNNKNTHEKLIKAWNGEEIEDDREEREENQGEYLVCTDDEADEKWNESIDNYIDECIIPEMNINNPERYFNSELFKEDCENDGRGHTLNRYDGCEYEENIDGKTYYIYQQ